MRIRYKNEIKEVNNLEFCAIHRSHGCSACPITKLRGRDWCRDHMEEAAEMLGYEVIRVKENKKQEIIFGKIRKERERQEAIHPADKENSPAEWAAILAEECGEAVKELNALQWGEPGHTNGMLVTELIHTAATAVRILEQLQPERWDRDEDEEEDGPDEDTEA